MDELDKLKDLPGVSVDPKVEEWPTNDLEREAQQRRAARDGWVVGDGQGVGICRLCANPIPEWQQAERQREDFIFRLKVKGLLQPDDGLCDACIAGRRTVEERCDMVEARAKHELPQCKGDWNGLRADVLEALTEAQIGATSRDYKLVGQYTEGLLAGMRMMGPWRDPEFPFEAWLKDIADGKVAIWGD
jgi:hypothetical protein